MDWEKLAEQLMQISTEVRKEAERVDIKDDDQFLSLMTVSRMMLCLSEAIMNSRSDKQ